MKIIKKWSRMGYIEQKDPQFNSGAPTFRHPKTKKWITPDQDGHKGGVWKLFKGHERLGTLDKNGKLIAS